MHLILKNQPSGGYKFARRVCKSARRAISEYCGKMSFEEVNVNPQEVRFSQDSISRKLTQDYECSIFNITPKPSSVRLLCQQMEKGVIKPSDFPPIEVYKDEEGITWSNDNRRLWVFRKAGVTSVPAKLSSMPLFRAPPPPEKRERMSRADYFPVVRGG